MSRVSTSPSTEESRLVEGFLHGDPVAVRTLDGWIDVVLRNDARSLRTHWDDLRQEIRTRVFRNLSRGVFDGRSALRTYVHRIAKNVCIDQARMEARRVRLDARIATGPEAVVEPDERFSRERLAGMLEGLSEADRHLLELVFVESCSYAEVAKRLSIPTGTVKSRMSRCKDRILALRRLALKRASS